LSKPAIQAEIVKAVQEQFRPAQLELEGITEQPNFAAVVAKTTELVQQQTITIPRIQVVPTGVVKSGFNSFDLKLETLRYPVPSEELWSQYLRTGKRQLISVGVGGVEEKRMENYVVSGLVDFDDISYDHHADLLYNLATQTVAHFESYLSEGETAKVLRYHQREIARFIHAQMQEHFWEDPGGLETKINAGFTELKPSAYTVSANDAVLDYRYPPSDKSNMAKYLFGSFSHCLYSVEKFQSDSERRLAVILEREEFKWFKPRKGQFQLFYKWGLDHPEYQPDFVAEGRDCIYMLEPKDASEMKDEQVIAKRDVGVKWCALASEYAATTGEKPWQYALIPHNVISDNMTIKGLVERYLCC
jgi:type III restriction enzyme